MRIFLNEEQLKFISSVFNEGIEYTRNSNGGINFRINSMTDDKSNYDGDTRVFGKAGEILYGDGTGHKNVKKLSDTFMDANTRVMQRRSAINFVNNGFSGNIDYDYDGSFKQKVLDKYEELKQESEIPKEDLINWLKLGIDRDSNITNAYGDKYARAKSAEKNGVNTIIPRYNLLKVPGTNIDVIALFLMNDFNFSDALKHGKLRQNGLTDDLLGITPDERERVKKFGKGKDEYKEIDVTYDNGIKPNIQNNFSLDNSVIGDGDHFKKSYGLNDENYTSISQFIDKSILTANYALKKLNFKPQFIVSAPSSSKFNEYYCINLSRKLGVEYVRDFFKRNVINIQFDNLTETELRNSGANENDIFKIKRAIINAVYAEISIKIQVPVNNFVVANQEYLSNITTEHYGRIKTDINKITGILTSDICKALLQENIMEKSIIYKNITKAFIANEINKTYNNSENRHIRGELGKAIKLKIGQKKFIELLRQVDVILQEHANYFVKGFNFNPNIKKFKIVDIEQRFRKCIHNVYVIADKELNQATNTLLARYQNANFLIFDDDMNSGATLKLVCDALEEKVDNGENKIKCLVNGFSLKGR